MRCALGIYRVYLRDHHLKCWRYLTLRWWGSLAWFRIEIRRRITVHCASLDRTSVYDCRRLPVC